MNCKNCGIDLSKQRSTAKFCSPNCRVTFSRKASVVTDSVTLTEPPVTLTFKFTVKAAADNPDDVKKDKRKVREAKYWYDVPLAAIPVLQEGWPEMPELMNGRQYFLWWKNEFITEEDGKPVILNPYPKYDKLDYVNAGEGSRRWGA